MSKLQIRTIPIAHEFALERTRQVQAEGWTPEHDDEHTGGELAMAAACYALSPSTNGMETYEVQGLWPFEPSWLKRNPNRRRDLIKAGALLIAEIDRLDRASGSQA